MSSNMHLQTLEPWYLASLYNLDHLDLYKKSV